MNKYLAIFIAIVGIVVLFLVARKHTPPPTPPQAVATALYACNEHKTITATYYQGVPEVVAQGEAPKPAGSVKIVLADRTLTLPQTLSADGARYSDGDPNIQGAETFVFWNKGRVALVLENNQEKNYTGCIEVANDPGGLTEVYQNGSDMFTLRYPSNYTPGAQKYQALGPGKDILGTKFTIPSSVASSTNLSSDSYISIEHLAQSQSCSANLFLDHAPAATLLTDEGTAYSVASTTGAGAGNRYEEIVYALPGSNPCVGVRYFIHYGVLANYPTGQVQEFNHTALVEQFDAIRRTLVLGK